MNEEQDIRSNEIFWNASVTELKKGFTEDEKKYTCVVCGETFEKGRIFEADSVLYDAGRTAELHVEARHGSMFHYLLGINSSFTGLSDIHRELLSLLAQGLSDKEAAVQMGVAPSTIRSHRYKLREKEKQAKLFLVLMDLWSSNTNKRITTLDKGVALEDAHKTATTLDDRYNITNKDRENTIKNHFDENGALKSYPVKEKKKIIVLNEIVKNFSKGRTYSEKEMNQILGRIYEDHVTIRRALVEYGFIERTNDGSRYWVKE